MDKAFYNSPLGWMEIRSNTSGVTHIHFTDEPLENQKIDSPFLEIVVQQLNHYFKHKSITYQL